MPDSVLARGALLNLLAKLATVAMGLGILTLVARMGPEVQGAFALFVAVESALLTLGSGPGLWLARQVSHFGESPGPRVHAALRLAALGGGAIGLVLVIAGLASEAVPYRHLWMLGLAAPALLMTNTATGLWLGQGRMARMNAPLVAAPALVLLGLAALRVGSGGAPSLAQVPAVLGIWVLAKTLVGLGTAGAVVRDAPPGGRGGTALLEPFRGQWAFLGLVAVTNVVSLANYRVSLFLVEQSQGLAATGVYSVAVQVAELLWLLSSSVTLSAYHRIGASESEVAARTTLRAVRINVLATVAAAPLLLLAARWAVPALLGEVYAGTIVPLACLLPGVAAYAAASSLSAYFTNHRGRPQWSTRIAGLSLLLNATLGAWAAPRWGAVGVACATSVAYIGAIAVGLASFLRATGLGWRALVGINDNPRA